MTANRTSSPAVERVLTQMKQEAAGAGDRAFRTAFSAYGIAEQKAVAHNAIVEKLCEHLCDALELAHAAQEFVEMASNADSSGGEYSCVCQECAELNGHHKRGCRLNAWLTRAAALFREEP